MILPSVAVRTGLSEKSRFYEPCVLRVETDCRIARRSFELRPQRICRPFALLSWGYRPESTLWSLKVGFREQLVQPVPLGAFSSLLTRGEFEGLLDRRPDGHDAVRALWRLFSYHELAIDTAELGQTLTLEVEGPFELIAVIASMPTLDPETPRP